MAKVRVQVSMFPRPIEVDEAEIPALRSQGILVSVETTAESAAEGKTDPSGSGEPSAEAGAGSDSSTPGTQDETGRPQRQRRSAAGSSGG